MQEVLQNCIHLQNTEPTEMISCILIVLLFANDRSNGIKLRIQLLVLARVHIFTLYNVCVQYIGGCSVHRGHIMTNYIGG